jgi:hypothetical protein
MVSVAASWGCLHGQEGGRKSRMGSGKGRAVRGVSRQGGVVELTMA